MGVELAYQSPFGLSLSKPLSAVFNEDQREKEALRQAQGERSVVLGRN